MELVQNILFDVLENVCKYSNSNEKKIENVKTNPSQVKIGLENKIYDKKNQVNQIMVPSVKDSFLQKHWFKVSQGKQNLKILAPFLTCHRDIQWFCQFGHQIEVFHTSRQVFVFKSKTLIHFFTDLNFRQSQQYLLN